MSSSSKTSTIIISVVAILVLIALLVYFLVFSKNAQYDKAISKADVSYTEQNYTEAKGNYEKALIIKPDEQYPMQRLEEIEVQLALQEMREKYETAIQTADGLFNQKGFTRAREFYLMAINYNDVDSYPVDQIRKIDETLIEMEAEAARNNKKDFRYHIVIGSFANGENALSLQKKYQAEGRKSMIVLREEFDMEAVTYDAYPDIHAAYNALKKVQEEITEDAWVIYYREK
jgi:tetratricopeptide (TPR) repeat protein